MRCRTGGMSWETWLVALGYTAYFVLRRRLATDHLGGHWLDMLLLVPAALWFVCARAPSSLGLVARPPAPVGHGAGVGPGERRGAGAVHDRQPAAAAGLVWAS